MHYDSCMNFGVSGEAIFLSLLLLMLLGSNKLPEIGRPVAVLVRGSRRASNGFRSAAKRALLLAFVGIALTVPSNLAQAQRIDAAVGVGTILAPGASSASSSEYPVSLSGGLYPGLSGDLIFWRNLGIGAEIYWRASQGVNYGGSVRAAQFLVLGAKARALMKGRYHVSFDDIRELYVPILRHRILLNFHAESDRLRQDDILQRVMDWKPAPRE